MGLGDVLHVGADEDQTAGAALAVADRNPGTDEGLRSFEFAFFCASSSLSCRSSFSYRA